MNTNRKKLGWSRRRDRVRRKVRGASGRPRLSVYRSEKHIYAQVIDDVTGTTLVAASSLSPEIRGAGVKPWGKEAAAKVGELVAARALAREISAVVFDRNGFLYHGRIQAVADGARKAGLAF
ncbi:MAG: 50S ribosomal protein L18 [bacterium]